MFYHDADIIFREIPLWDNLLKNDVWYVSDTTSYLGKEYLLNNIGRDGFESMCKIVGVNPSLIDENAGGAQYLIKNVESNFWKKVEIDSENIYAYLEKYSGLNSFPEINVNEGIQAWCSDMWAFWWNALLCKKKFLIHSCLNFSWADSSIEAWSNTYILHYTGHIKKEESRYFRKLDYCYHEPFFDNFSTIDTNSCSYPLVQMIGQYRRILEENRVEAKDFTFLITITTNTLEDCISLYVLLKYLSKYLNTYFKVVEIGVQQLIEKKVAI